MSTLEVLMKAEKSLLDESIPFDFDTFYDCTCGHILRAVEGKPGYAGTAGRDYHPEYMKVIQEVASALGFDEEDPADSIYAVSNHTATARNDFSITRKDALITIRIAMMALQPEVEYATA